MVEQKLDVGLAHLLGSVGCVLEISRPTLDRAFVDELGLGRPRNSWKGRRRRRGRRRCSFSFFARSSFPWGSVRSEVVHGGGRAFG